MRNNIFHLTSSLCDVRDISSDRIVLSVLSLHFHVHCLFHQECSQCFLKCHYQRNNNEIVIHLQNFNESYIFFDSSEFPNFSTFLFLVYYRYHQNPQNPLVQKRQPFTNNYKSFFLRQIIANNQSNCSILFLIAHQALLIIFQKFSWSFGAFFLNHNALVASSFF